MTGQAPLRAISSHEIEAFERDGYVGLERVLAPEWLTPLEQGCSRLLDAPETLDITEETLRSATPSAGQLFDAPSYQATLARRGHFYMNFNTARRERTVLEFALGGAMGGIAAALMRSSRVCFVDDIMFVKEPGTHEATEWHDDDNGSIASGRQRCSVWVSLSDVPENAGALRFLRGSHLRHAGWRERGVRADALVAASPDDVRVCPVRRGDVVVHDVATIHGAAANTSSAARRAWALRFAGDDARFLLRPARREHREWYGLKDGDPLIGPRFPVAWPPQRLDPFEAFGAPLGDAHSTIGSATEEPS
jgi:hypothetical protein